MNSWTKYKRSGTYHRDLKKYRDGILKRASDISNDLKKSTGIIFLPIADRFLIEGEDAIEALSVVSLMSDIILILFNA